MKLKIIKWLIRLLLKGYHLSRNPTKKHKGASVTIAGAGELSSVGLKGDGARGKQ